MSEERLQKIMSRAGIASRRKAEEIIEQGRVTVNGAVATLGDKADLARDAVKVDGKRVQEPAPRRYFLLNKPAGTITAKKDPEGRPVVFDLLPRGERRGLVAVGRLDFHSEGLLLLTDDGDFAHRIAHPRYGCRKTYAVKVKGTPDEASIEKLRSGITLKGRRTAPAKIREQRGKKGHRAPSANSWWTVVLSEGRSRQIREMFFRIGHPVQRLRRVGIGPLRDPRLAPGEVRPLREGEREKLLASTKKPGGKGR